MTMHSQTADPHAHQHVFLGDGHGRNERRVWLVVALTAATMVVEIVAGTIYGSMALLADGWHMGTHVAALAISAIGYVLARRYADDPRFAFGTGKFGDLAGFASAIALGLTAILIAWEAVQRLQVPVPIAFTEALAVAVVGLAVNLVSAWILRDDHAHGHNHTHDHTHGHEHVHGADHNLRAAYLHVLADALTSLLAIAALLAGRTLGWTWTDPAVALVGAAVIAGWSWGLIRRTGLALLDADAPATLRQAVEEAVAVEGDRICDLHVWRVGPGQYAAIVCVVSPEPRCGETYRARIGHLTALRHVTIETRREGGVVAAQR
jgi:cation diffusion facilitator family transporter